MTSTDHFRSFRAAVMLALPGGALGPHHTHRYEQPPRTQHGFCGGSLQRRVHPGRGTGPSPTHSLGLAMSSGSTVSAISTISNVASAAIVALGALWLTQQRSEVGMLPDSLQSTCHSVWLRTRFEHSAPPFYAKYLSGAQLAATV